MSQMPKTSYHLRTLRDRQGGCTKIAVTRNEHGLWTTLRELLPPVDERPTIEQATAWAIQVAEQDRVDRANGVQPDSQRLQLAEKPGGLLESTEDDDTTPESGTPEETTTETAALV